MRRIMMMMLAVLVATESAAQVVATPAHRWAWTQDGDRTNLSWEIALDGQPYSPVLGVQCDAVGDCNGDMTVGLAEGAHTARLRTVKTVNGTRFISAGQSNDLAIIFGTAPPAPRNFGVQPPAGVSAAGTIRERFPMVGLDVARVWLDAGADLYIGAAQLSVPGYSAQPGDRIGLVLYRP